MNKKKKIIIGSLGMVTILILISFTNVIGLQSIKSTSVDDTPLFSIRTQKAINQSDKTNLISDYLGKGFNELSFPILDNRTALFQKIIEIIQRLDDKEFNKFQSLILSQIYKNKNIENTNNVNLLNILKQSVFQKDSDFKQYNKYFNFTHPPTQYLCPTYFPLNCFTMGKWFPGCLVSFILVLIVGFFGVVYYEILHLLISILEEIQPEKCRLSHTAR